jgi:hypothetical protein
VNDTGSDGPVRRGEANPAEGGATALQMSTNPSLSRCAVDTAMDVGQVGN